MDYNFENQLRDKLKARSIEPSANAWERVKNRPAKKKKITPIWYGIAVAVVIGLFFFANLENEQVVRKENHVVIQQSETKSELPKSEVLPKIIISEKQQPQIIVKTETQTESPKAVEAVNHLVTQRVVLLEKPMTDFQLKANEIAINLEKLQRSGTEVTEAMLDSMIRSAHMQIVAERMELSPQKADPNQLLSEAEKELDKSFKERIFGALQGKIRIALGSGTR